MKERERERRREMGKESTRGFWSAYKIFDNNRQGSGKDGG
jgi:hypothetical protein